MPFSQQTVGIYTLGCKVNQYESEAIAEALESRGFTVCSPTLPCDAYVINTCTVTAESDRKARQFIRRAIHQNPRAFVLVTGCLAQ
ncbi:MAG: tRNA (N(6)-L-threonylcarbamoyladenosine(37)-C(2))-methylthiotransferase MtaB, partial [Clostridia bacterium]|nr:tRNA (N(6)-L-threonylcarbamoyladenosine(37)-C(2))-methylthiotransferase MtaB [Clostridia bacterium]